MRVLLSIKPEFAMKIFDGSKKYEYRRIIFRKDQVKYVVVYASAPLCKVIGEFEIDDILHDDLEKLWSKTKKHAGIKKDKFLHYFSNARKGYAIHIKNPAPYKRPISLDKLMVGSPPQSFVYLG